MSPKRCYIIANPAAGHGAAARAIPRLEALCRTIGLEFDLVRTERRGHAIDLAREAALAGAGVVVAAGGDGTTNEVINGLMQAKRKRGTTSALGILGIGRGNDFAHTVGVPKDLSAACDTLVAGFLRPIDLGRVTGGIFPEGRFFGNCVGVGFDAITTIEVMKLPRYGGFVSFFIAVMRTIFLYYKGPLVRIEIDDRSLTQPVLLVSVMNGRRLGGGFWMAPESLPDDGLFDLCIAHEVGRLRILGMIPHFLRGTQASQPEITMSRAQRIAIIAERGVLPAQTDGEIICEDGVRLDIELLPRELEVVSAEPGRPA